MRCGEQASWVPGQTPLGSAAKEQWEWEGAASADVWENVPMAKAFQKEAGVG